MLQPLRLLLITLLLANLLPPLRAELTLGCEINGKSSTISRVERHRILVGNGTGMIEAPADTVWTISGDLRENAAYLECSPYYSLSRIDLPDRERDTAPRPFRASVGIRHMKKTGKTGETPFLQRWPSFSDGPALFVAAWVVDGGITQVKVCPTPPPIADNYFARSLSFELSPAEARGQAVVLLWRNGGFEKTKPRFPDPKAAAAFTAVIMDDLPALQAALASGVSANARDEDGIPLLQYAAEAGSNRVLAELLAQGAKFRKDKNEAAILNWAIAKGRLGAVQTLLSLKPDLEALYENDTPLVHAIRDRHEEIASMLLAAGADPKHANPFGLEPISAAINVGATAVAVQLLTANPSTRLDGDQAERALLTQTRLGHTGTVKLMLKEGVGCGIEYLDSTALISGTHSGDPAIAEALLAAGAKVDQTTKSGATALMMACGLNKVEYARVLLDKGAKPNLARSDGASALHYAASGNAADTIRLLLERGANLHARNVNGTPLEVAIKLHAAEAAQVLADAGGTIDIHAKEAQALMERLIAYDLAPALQRAIGDGWNVNSTFPGGWSALSIATACRSNRCFDVLQNAGATASTTATMTPANKLDARVRPVRIISPIDPRDVTQSFPASTLLIEIVIDTDGQVRFARLAEPAPAILTNPALRAVEKWKFTPPTVGGQPTTTKVQLPLNFGSSDEITRQLQDVDTMPQAITRATPEFPEYLRRHGYSGEVQLGFVVNESGRVEQIRVVTSAHPDFDEVATRALAKWTFKPALLDGRPTRCYMVVPIVFMLVD